MSTTIDQRVVEMRFDNKHFENNVSTTMSTLDKLKQKLNLDGAAKGLENVNTAAGKVNMTGLGSAVETVSAKFSALQVVGVTALANIANSAVNAGKRIVSALTIDPVKSGLQEYETKMGSIQTILANTQHQGTTMDDVTAALEELNLYADKTIYNFQEMTRNIGTFTAAGVDLDTSVKSIQGIANLAAVSGSTSQQASTAMYQLSQALATGTVKLMDWNSVVNAGMGGKVFQNALIQTAAMLDGASEDVAAWQKENIDAHGSFRDSLTQGAWLTSEVLTQTLKQFTMAAEEGTEEWEAYKKSLMETGYTEAQAIEILKMANTATDAATKVKTFTQLFDTLKESAQSGWAQTWELIFGDFEEAKEFFTGLSDMLGGLINSMSEYRNNLFAGALDSNWDKLVTSINKAGIKTGEYEEAIRDVWVEHGKTSEQLDEVISKYGSLENAIKNGAVSSDILKEALATFGIGSSKAEEKLATFVEDLRTIERTLGMGSVGDDVKSLQTALEALGHSVGECKIDGIVGPDTTAAIKEFQKEVGLTVDGIAGPETIAALEKAGTSFDEITGNVENADASYDELIDNITDKGGRQLFLEGFANIINGLVGLFRALGTAWADVFPASDAQTGLFNALETFSNLTKSVRLFDEVVDENGESVIKFTETGEKLVQIFKGIFAIVDVVATVLGGGLRIALNVVTQILGYFNIGVLDAIAAVSSVIVGFRDWFKTLFDISVILDAVIPFVQDVAQATSDWFDAFKSSTGLQNAISYINELVAGIKDWWANLINVEDLPRTMAEGIVSFFSNVPSIITTVFGHIRDAFVSSFAMFEGDGFGGLFSGMTYGIEVAIQTVIELGSILLEKLNEFLNAHGFSEISADAIAGLVSGFKTGAVDAWNAAVEMANTLVQKVKDFLGIHSPSTVFMAIGGFIIAGLIAGLQNGGSGVFDSIKETLQPALDWLMGLDFGAILAAILGLSIANTANKTASALEAFSSPFEGVGELLEGVGETLKKSARPIKKILNNTAKVVKNFSKVLGSVAFNIKAEGIKTLAESLLMLAAAVAILSLCDVGKMWSAVGAMVVLAGVLAGLALAMDKLNSASVGIGKEGIDIKGLSSGLIQIGVAIMLLAVAVKLMGSMEPDEAIQGFLGLAGLVIAIGGVIAAFGLLVKGKAAENVDKFGQAMGKIGIALVLMAVVVKMLGGMDRNELIQGGVAILAFSGLMVGLMAATKLISGSKNVEVIGDALFKIAAAIGIMGLVAKLLGGMDMNELIQGGVAIIAFSGIIVGLMAATKLITGSKNIDKIGDALLKIALAIGVMGLVAKLLGNMETGELLKGGLAITAFSGIIVGLMAATKLIAGSKNIDKIGGAILAISGAIAIMAATAFMLSMISWEGFAKGTLMITIFSGIIVGLMAATKLVGGTSGADEIGKTLISVAGAIGILALIAVLLGLVPLNILAKGTAIVAALSLIMGGLIFVTKFAQGCVGNIVAITIAIAAIAGAVYLLSTIPAEKAVPAAIMLGGLMGIMAGVLAVTSMVGKDGKSALMGVLALTAMAVPLLAFVGVLAVMQNITVATGNVLALVGLATAMTLLLIPLTIVGAAGMTGAPYLGVLALLAMAVPLLAFVGILALMSGIQNGVSNALALAVLVTAIGDVLFKLSLVAPLALVAVGAIGALVKVIAAFGVLAVAIGGLVTYFPQIQTFIDTGIAVMEQLASGLGSIIGSFITGFAGEVMSMLPPLGASLSAFMVNAMPFIIGAKMVDGNVLTGVGILAGAIVALTAADLIAGVSSFIQGGSSFADLGTQLSQFMVNAMPFIMGASLLNADMMTGVKTLADTVLTLTAANVLEGLASWVTGGSSLSDFGSQLGGLGTSLSTFVSNLGTFDEAQVATVTCAANAIKALAQASAEIPNAGGLLASLVGENDLGTFAAQFPILGEGLRSFLDGVGTFTDAQVATVTCAANAIKSLAEVANEIPNEGGWASKLFGDNAIGGFASQLPDLGSNLSAFASNLGTFDESTVTTVTCAANAIKSMADVAGEIDGQADWAAKLFGDNSLSGFGGQLASFGANLRDFVTNLGTFTYAQVSTVRASVDAIKALSGLASVNLSSAKMHLGGFGDKLTGFAEDIASFCTSMPDSSTVTNAVTGITSLLSAIEDIGAANTGCLATFADNLKQLGKNAVSKFVEAFTSSEAKTNVKAAAEALTQKAADGIEIKGRSIKNAGKAVAEKAVDGVDTQKDDMESAGKDLGSGLVIGIEAKYEDAYNAGYALGQKAVQGEKDGQQSKSPSKATIKAGKWLGEGLVIGIERMGNSVYSAGANMGREAISSISKSISRISELVSSDIDAQPTIRPVLDLSDVKNGAGVIGGMLGGTSIGVSANLNSISNMMNSRGQNGGVNEVVSAIDKLRKDLGNVGNTTYTVNGVTYDDGSNVSDAVQALVRAAIMERRI